MSPTKDAPDDKRRGLVAAVAAGLAVVAGGLLGRLGARWRSPRGPGGFRRVKPWSDEALTRPHDDAG